LLRAPVVTGGRSGVRTAGRDLHVPQRDTGIEGCGPLDLGIQDRPQVNDSRQYCFEGGERTKYPDISAAEVGWST
jgi:hypothetical protein